MHYAEVTGQVLGIIDNKYDCVTDLLHFVCWLTPARNVLPRDVLLRRSGCRLRFAVYTIEY